MPTMGQDKVFYPGRDNIFVFGSNMAGIHGLGAALQAHRYYSAPWGKGEGLTLKSPEHNAGSYALPTKDRNMKPLELSQIKECVERFLEVAWENKGLRFFVTRVGCGLAGFTDDQIAPMFREAPVNCELPYGWRGEEVK
jgi:hypothetical protein